MTKPPAAEPKLNDQQRAFIRAYVQHWNGTRAAIEAGYSERRARSTATDLLRNAAVKEALAELMREQAMGADEVLARLAEEARGSIADFIEVDGEGNFVGFKFDKSRPLHLIKSISKTDKGIKVELYDAQAAKQLIGRGLGLFQPDGATNVQVNIQVTADDLARARSELAEFHKAVEPDAADPA